MHASLVLLGPAVLLGFGCKPPPTTTPLGPDIDNGDVRDMQEATGCDEDENVYAYLGDEVHTMTGCGQTTRFARVWGNWANLTQLVKRAEFDLDCQEIDPPQEALGADVGRDRVWPAARTYVARGLEWIMNNTAEEH